MFSFINKFIVSPRQLKKAGILGMNRRNFEYILKKNPRHLFPLVDDKLQTKKLAIKHNINVPDLFGKIEFQYEAKNIHSIIKEKKSFVIKPAHGSGGRGIMVVKDHKNDVCLSTSDSVISKEEIYKHVSNILSGLYSLGGQSDTAIIEECINFTKEFNEYSYQGVPDVRIIVYRGFPVMAMIRLSTKESGGRANLHQGAVGVGINLNTGKAIQAVMNDKLITNHPDTGADLSKLFIPQWKKHLLLACKSYEMTNLEYIGADIVLDQDKGPMMLELNARPGLAIQIANGSGLKNNLKKIDKLVKKNNFTAEERLEFSLKNLKN